MNLLSKIANFKNFFTKKVNVDTHFMFKLETSLKEFTRRIPDRINLYKAKKYFNEEADIKGLIRFLIDF
jgi:hypothetical protein